MCGVVGLLLRDASLESSLGSMLVPMVERARDRGPDSSGIALYGDGPEAVGGLLVSLGSDADVDWEVLESELDLGSPSRFHRFGTGAVVNVVEEDEPELRRWLSARWPEVRILGTGESLQVLKDTGSPVETCERYGVGRWQGYLAVAHTRMATESAVTVLHSHPFVPGRDLCVVHNGSFSNYATVRRRLEAEGVALRLGQRLGGGGPVPCRSGWRPATTLRRPPDG